MSFALKARTSMTVARPSASALRAPMPVRSVRAARPTLLRAEPVRVRWLLLPGGGVWGAFLRARGNAGNSHHGDIRAPASPPSPRAGQQVCRRAGDRRRGGGVRGREEQGVRDGLGQRE